MTKYIVTVFYVQILTGNFIAGLRFKCPLDTVAHQGSIIDDDRRFPLQHDFACGANPAGSTANYQNVMMFRVQALSPLPGPTLCAI